MKKYLDLSGLTRYDEKIKVVIDQKMAEAASGKITMLAVEQLPPVAEASHNVIYLVPNSGSGTNVKDEYILVGTGASAAFELIGTTQVDISGKADKAVPSAAGNLAALDANGNLIDGGAKSQFAASSHTHVVAEITDLSAITTSEIDALFVTLISFTINGTTYQAESGMTWGEWFDSEYNTGAFDNTGSYAICSKNNDVYYTNQDEIIANAFYILSSSGGQN